MKQRRIIFLLVLLGAMTSLSMDIYLPSMEAIRVSLGTGMGKVQLSLSVFLLSFGCGQLVYGPLSDRYGRKKPLLWGLVLYGVANLCCALAPNVEILIMGRFLQGLGACCGTVSGLAIVRDLFKGTAMTRVVAITSAAISLAPILAPMLGASLDALFGWRSSFVFLAVFAVLLLVLIAAFLPETHEARGGVFPMARDYGRFLSHRIFRVYTLVHVLAFAALFAFITGAAPLMIGKLGLSPTHFSLVFGINAMMFMAGSMITTGLSKRFDLAAIAGIGSGLMLLGGTGMLLLAGEAGVARILAPMCLVTLGVALALPASIGGALEPFGERAGGASALLGFLKFSGASAVGILLSHWATRSALPMALTITVAAIGCLSALYFGLRTRSIPASQLGCRNFKHMGLSS